MGNLSNRLPDCDESCYQRRYEAYIKISKKDFGLNLTEEGIINITFVSISGVSGLALFIVGMFIWRHPKFTSSHYKLIYQACLFESMMLCSSLTHFMQQYEQHLDLFMITKGLPRLIGGASIADVTTSWDHFDAWLNIELVYNILYNVGQILALYLNSVLIFDIYFTLRNPFKPYQQRYSLYKYFGVVLFLCFTWIIILSFNNIITPPQKRLLQVSTGSFMSVITIMGFILILLKINTQGTSKDLKKLVITRHGAYFAVYMLFLAYNYSDYYSDSIPLKFSTIQTMENYFLISGIGLAYVRIREPYVWIEFKKVLCCGKSTDHKKAKFTQESLDNFLKSACNTEYASFSLVGIIQSTKNSHKSTLKL